MIHIFDPEVLHEVAQSVIDRPMNEKVELIRSELARIYPGHVQDKVEWIFNIAGGALGQMAVLHASISEYVIIFGSPIGTEGYSGRFQADDYFIILEGEQWVFGEGDFDRTVYRPGEMHHMPRGHARGYRMPDKCFALEYARGWIPLMLPFGLADSFTSTVDPIPVAQTMKVYTKAVLGEWLTLARERGFFGGRAALPVPGPSRIDPRTKGDKPATAELRSASASARLSK